MAETDRRPRYDRELLLYSAKRTEVLELWEVQRYGSDSYGDPDYVSIYGMVPAAWHAKGARVLGRTAVECTPDRFADLIGEDVAGVVGACPATRPRVVDLFAGSGNTLYWLLRHLPGAHGVGFESDDGVFGVTRQNFAALELPLHIQNTDYRPGLSGISVLPSELLIFFIAPPWGNAYDPTRGLDLRRTAPPVMEILHFLRYRFLHNRHLCAIQVHETLFPASAAELRVSFDWSILRIYDLNAPGQNHGILLGTGGWAPPGGHIGGHKLSTR